MKDTFKTIEGTSEGVFKDKGSKFISILLSVDSEDEAMKQLELIKQEHPKARHHCYAFRLGIEGDIERYNDDGEPSGTAGRPILGQLKSAELTNIIAVVVRYYGGTKLGVSGLIEAYRDSTKEATAQAKIIRKQLCMRYAVNCPYSDLPMIMESLKFANITMTDKNFEKVAELIVQIPLSKTEKKWNIAATHYIGHSATIEDLKEKRIVIRELGVQ